MSRQGICLVSMAERETVHWQYASMAVFYSIWTVLSLYSEPFAINTSLESSYLYTVRYGIK